MHCFDHLQCKCNRDVALITSISFVNFDHKMWGINLFGQRRRKKPLKDLFVYRSEHGELHTGVSFQRRSSCLDLLMPITNEYKVCVFDEDGQDYHFTMSYSELIEEQNNVVDYCSLLGMTDEEVIRAFPQLRLDRLNDLRYMFAQI